MVQQTSTAPNFKSSSDVAWPYGPASIVPVAAVAVAARGPARVPAQLPVLPWSRVLVWTSYATAADYPWLHLACVSTLVPFSSAWLPALLASDCRSGSQLAPRSAWHYSWSSRRASVEARLALMFSMRRRMMPHKPMSPKYAWLPACMNYCRQSMHRLHRWFCRDTRAKRCSSLRMGQSHVATE